MPGRSTGAEDHLRAIQQALHTDARGEVLVAVAARMWQIVQCVNVWLSLSRPRGDQANATLVSDEAHCVEPLDAPRAVVLTRWVETPDEDADAD